MRIRFWSILLVACLVSTETAAAASVIHVRPGGSGSGTSWIDAYGDLQAALTASLPGDELWVAEGTWLPGLPGDTGATFSLRDDVALYGGFAGTELTREERLPTMHETILSGDLGQDDVYTPWPSGWNIGTPNASHVVTAADVGAGALLDGFTILAGYAVSTTGGGGLLISSGDPTIRACRFLHNAVGFTSGGAILVAGGAPVLQECTFVENYAHLGNGAGIQTWGTAHPLIEGCSFAGNIAVGSGSGGDGGAISIQADLGATVRRCTFEDNVSRNFYAAGDYDIGWGGAIFNFADGTIIDSCVFLRNHAHAGGAVSTWGDQVTIANSTFDANVVTSYEMSGGGSGGDFGGGVAATSFYGEATSLINCTVSGNSAGEGGGVASLYGHVVTVRNTIIAGNLGTGENVSHLDAQIKGTADFAYSCVEALLEPIPGEDPPDPANYPGCLDADPRFVAPVAGDFRLQSTSPCIDAGENAAVPPYVVLDLDGHDRRFDAPDSPDTGSGTPPLVDMGPYEHGAGAALVGEPPEGDLPFTLTSFPNPSFLITTLSWALPLTAEGGLQLFDCTGRLTTRLRLSEGARQVAWDGRDDEGRQVPGGVYFARLIVGGRTRGNARLLRLD